MLEPTIRMIILCVSQRGGVQMDDAGYWLFVLLVIYPTWRIFSRIGLSGATSLLLLIPGLGFSITLFVLAYAKWPNYEGDQ